MFALSNYPGAPEDAAVEEHTREAPRVVWQPLKGSQIRALCCPAHMILYHGTRGPGKTDVQLMRFRGRVGLGYGPYWRGIIFDHEYKNLDDLVAKSMRWFPAFGDGARFLSSKSDYRWVWPGGEQLLFRAIKNERDYWSYHGQEFPYIGWNELTKYKNEALFDMMMSCNRSSFRADLNPVYIDREAWENDGAYVLVPSESVTEYTAGRFIKRYLPEIPLEVFATCNPHGVGHNWVKRRFISVAKPGQVARTKINVFNPRTQQREDIVKTAVHLFGSYKENIFLSPEYVGELELIKDKNKRKAWLGGSWDIAAGGMFDEEWDSAVHVCDPFDIPSTWRIDRAFDWGSSKPFSVGWWAESDGSDVTMRDGSVRSTVRGDLFRISEWYGWDGKKPNTGLRMLATEVAEGIVKRELAQGLHGRVVPGPADNSIWDVENGNSIAADMSKPVRVGNKVYPGIIWARSDKSPGSRKAGWNQIRERLHAATPKYVQNAQGRPVRIPREAPGLFCFRSCTMFQQLVPSLPRSEEDPDDVDTDAEDHIGDETRYRVLSSRTRPRNGKTKGTR